MGKSHSWSFATLATSVSRVFVVDREISGFTPEGVHARLLLAGGAVVWNFRVAEDALQDDGLDRSESRSVWQKGW